MKNKFTAGALAVLTIGAVTGCWYQDGGDAAHSGFDTTEHTVTAANVSTLKRAWTTTVGQPYTSPVADGQSVFASGAEGVTAYDLATGTRRWNVLAPDGGTANESIKSFENLTIDNDGIYANYHLYYGEGVSTRDKATGAALPGLSSTAPFGPSPASDKVVRDDASARVTQTGKCALGGCAWFMKYGDLSPTSTAYKNALVATSGSSIPPGSDCTTFPCRVQPSLIGRFAVVAVGPLVKAYSLDTCVTDPAYASACLPAWSVDLGSPASTPVGIDGTRVAVAAATGDIKILNLSTGKTIFTADMPTATTTMPAVGPTSFYAGGPNGKVYAFPKAGCGTPICPPTWSVDTGTANAISHQPAIGADVVYAGTANGKVIALATTCASATCAPLWTGSISATAAAPVQGIALQDGSIIATSSARAAGSVGTIAAFRLP